MSPQYHSASCKDILLFMLLLATVVGLGGLGGSAGAGCLSFHSVEIKISIAFMRCSVLSELAAGNLKSTGLKISERTLAFKRFFAGGLRELEKMLEQILKRKPTLMRYIRQSNELLQQLDAVFRAL